MWHQMTEVENAGVENAAPSSGAYSGFQVRRREVSRSGGRKLSSSLQQDSMVHNNDPLITIMTCLHRLSRIWNSLPLHVTSAPSLLIFRSRVIFLLFLIKVLDHVQCLCSDTCHSGHFSRSCCLLTYTRTIIIICNTE